MFHEITDLATKYSKSQLAQMAQTGLIDPTKAVMAGMMIDRISKQNMQPPTTTVAQDILQQQQQPQMGMQQPPQGQPQAQPQAPQSQGLPGIPAPNMEKMAGGGIVAFDEGGHVPGYADRGLVQDDAVYDPVTGAVISGGSPASQSELSDYSAAELLGRAVDPNYKPYRPAVKPVSPKTAIAPAPSTSAANSAPFPPNVGEGGAEVKQARIRTLTTELMQLEAERRLETDPAKIKGLDAQIAGRNRELIAASKQSATNLDGFKDATKATPMGLAALPTGQEQAAVQPSKGIGAIMGEIEATPQVSNIKQQYAGLQKDIEASNKASDEFAAKRPEYVPNEKYEKSLQKEEAGTEAKQKENFKMALINAGLAIAGGKSQFALQNIAEGAQVGTKQYMEGMKDLEKAAKEREKALAGIEEARNLYADKKYDRAQAMFDKNQDRLLGAKQTAITAATSITGKEIDTAGTMVNSQNTSNAYIQASQAGMENKEAAMFSSNAAKYMAANDKNPAYINKKELLQQDAIKYAQDMARLMGQSGGIQLKPETQSLMNQYLGKK